MESNIPDMLGTRRLVPSLLATFSDHPIQRGCIKIEMNIHRVTLVSTILIGTLFLMANAYRLITDNPCPLVAF